MAFIHSKGSVIKISNSGASLIDVSAYADSYDFGRTIATHDVTVLGNNSLAFIIGLKDGDDFSISFLWDATIEAQMNGIFGIATNPTYEIAPEGTATGKRKLTGSCILTKIGMPVKVGDKVLLPCTFKKSGDVTATTYP